MNTKFPLNGRYTTLGDLIHEYAHISTWPPDNREDEEITLLTIPPYGYKKEDVPVPFINVVYGKDYNGTTGPLVPYDVVWFHNVYSTTEKEKNLKSMKVIQKRDSSISLNDLEDSVYYRNSLGFDTPITAAEVNDPDMFYEFRFITASLYGNKDNCWYYNYKTSDGESVVMYALRKIIEIDKKKAYTLFFGDNTYIIYDKNTPSNDEGEEGEPIIEPLLVLSDSEIERYDKYCPVILKKKRDLFFITVKKNSNRNEIVTIPIDFPNEYPENSERLWLHKITTYINESIDSSFAATCGKCIYNALGKSTVKSTERYQPYEDSTNIVTVNDSIPVKLPINENTSYIINAPSYDFNIDDIYDIGFPLFKTKNNDVFDISENNENIRIDSNAYTYLGSNVWTLENVLYRNYSSELPVLLKDDVFDPNILLLEYKYEYTLDTKHGSNTIKGELNDEVLLNTIRLIYSLGENEDTEYREHIKSLDSSEKNKNIVYRVLYYATLFLRSLRFFISYVNAFRFIKISSKTYAQNEPVLRCDLGYIQIIEYFLVHSAFHLKSTALPAGPLSESTQITVRITYTIKYNNIPANNIPETHDIPITFKHLRLTYPNDENSFIWYRLAYVPYITDVTEYLKSNKTDINVGYAYGAENSLFKQIPYTTTDGQIRAGSDCSLGILKWPFNLELSISKEELNTRKNYPGPIGEYCWDTADMDTFKETPESTFSATNMEEIIKTNGISPWGILRVHNYFDNSTEDNVRNSSLYVDVSLFRCGNYYYIADNLTADSINEIKLHYVEPSVKEGENYILPDNLITVISSETDKDETISAELSNNTVNVINTVLGDITEIYMTFKSISGKYNIFASGATELTGEGNSEQKYTNTPGAKLYYKTTSNLYFAESSNSTIKSIKINGLDAYKILIKNMNSTCIYKIKFTDNEMNYYFKTVTNIRNTRNIEVCPLCAINTSMVDKGTNMCAEFSLSEDMGGSVTITPNDIKYTFITQAYIPSNYTYFSKISSNTTATIPVYSGTTYLKLISINMLTAADGVGSSKAYYSTTQLKMSGVSFYIYDGVNIIKKEPDNVYEPTPLNLNEPVIYTAINDIYVIKMLSSNTTHRLKIKSINLTDESTQKPFDIYMTSTNSCIFSYAENSGNKPTITWENITTSAGSTLKDFIISGGYTGTIRIDDGSAQSIGEYLNIRLVPGVHTLVYTIEKAT